MRGKRQREGWLTAEWSKKEQDLLISYPSGPDGHLLYGALTTTCLQRDLVTELKERGYDIRTLQFSVRRKQVSPEATKETA